MTKFQLFLIMFVLSVVGLLLETTRINFPFVFIIASSFVIFKKDIPTYVFMFVLGFVIDALRVTHFGITPIFIFATIVGINLYERYFGSSDAAVAIVIATSLVIAYTFFVSYSMVLLTSFLVFICVAFFILNILKKKGILLG